MREYIEANLTVIRKYLKKRKKYTSKLNNASITEEFKEWSKDPLPKTELSLIFIFCIKNMILQFKYFIL